MSICAWISQSGPADWITAVAAVLAALYAKNAFREQQRANDIFANDVQQSRLSGEDLKFVAAIKGADVHRAPVYKAEVARYFPFFAEDPDRLLRLGRLAIFERFIDYGSKFHNQMSDHLIRAIAEEARARNARRPTGPK